MYKRSRFLIDPSVQWSITGRVLIHWGLFLTCLVALGTFVRVLVVIGEQPLSEALQTAAVSQVPVLAVMFVLLPLFLRDTLKLSNRFAGPMFRLRTSLKKLAGEQSTAPISFRKGDFWQEAADDFNHVCKMVETLQTENAELRSQIAEFRSEVNEPGAQAADESHSSIEGSQIDGSQPGGSQIDGSQIDGSRSDGSQSDEQQTLCVSH